MKEYVVVFTTEAKHDLEEIRDYITNVLEDSVASIPEFATF